jgi:ribosomal protein L37AE/L43A
MWVKRLLSRLLFFRRREHRCSFCNTPQSAVRQLIAGASAFICDECVAVCHGIAQDATNHGERPRSTGAISICLVCKRGKAGPDCILVPTRGPVCRECVDIVKAATTTSTELRDD